MKNKAKSIWSIFGKKVIFHNPPTQDFCIIPSVFITPFSNQWNKVALEYAREKYGYVNETQSIFSEEDLVKSQIKTDEWNKIALEYARKKEYAAI